MNLWYHGEKEEEVNSVLLELKNVFAAHMGDNLKGLYLHGSLAMGCFRPWSSDYDLLAVAHAPMSREQKLWLVEDVMKIAEAGEAFRRIECSIVLAEEALKARHPIRYIPPALSAPNWKESSGRGSRGTFCNWRAVIDAAVAAYSTGRPGVFPDDLPEFAAKLLAGITRLVS